MEFEFQPFPKMSRLSKECIITEKIDGTNAQIFIDLASDAQKVSWSHLADPYLAVIDGLVICAGSRNRWVTPKNDNYGFASWVFQNAVDLVRLGPGRHFGEWWGNGIQRGYGQKQKWFSLFNVQRWCLHDQHPQVIPSGNPTAPVKLQERLPACVGLVPVLYRGIFTTADVSVQLELLENQGSAAAPGFMQPEGIVVWHTGANIGFKKTLGGDGHKGT